MSPVLWTTAALMTLRLAGELVLSGLNRAEVRRNARVAPPAAAAIMDAETYRRSVDYTLAKSRFGVVTGLFDALVLAMVIFGGILPVLFAEITAWGAPGAVWSRVAFILAAAMLLSIPPLPFEWWEQFSLEERFGFNKSTAGLWVTDKLKGLLLLVVIGFPLLWTLLSLVTWAGAFWWIWGFALFFGFQLLMLVLYPKLILPLFNRLTPLPAGELRDRLLALGERTGFRASTIEVIDGSKRSGHSNAYFTGFGRFRRIVLFDTLIAQLTAEELEAVLAHEIGHYRRGHIPKMIALAAVMLLGGFAVIAWLARSPWFNESFGFKAHELAPSFLLFGLLSGFVTFWFSPLTNLLSRRHEYEADAFAREAVGGAQPLVGALRKLAQKNLSNLTPHPWFSAFSRIRRWLSGRRRSFAAPEAACAKGKPRRVGSRRPGFWGTALGRATLAGCAFAASFQAVRPLGAEVLQVATYNVENYGPANRITESGYRPDYPKPEAEKQVLRRVIREVGAEVLALQEMGSDAHLEELRSDLQREGLDYPYAALAVAADGDRHLALLSRRRLSGIVTHSDLRFTYFGKQESVKRGLLEATVATTSGDVTLFVVHLKSRITDRPDDALSEVRRVGEARAVRDAVLARFPNPAAARFMVLGDFNDGRASKSLSEFAAAGKSRDCRSATGGGLAGRDLDALLSSGRNLLSGGLNPGFGGAAPAGHGGKGGDPRRRRRHGGERPSPCGRHARGSRKQIGQAKRPAQGDEEKR
jgi:STE24 endopeptidase